MAKSIEEQIEDCAKQWLLKDKNIKYFTKTESINDVLLWADKKIEATNRAVGRN